MTRTQAGQSPLHDALARAAGLRLALVFGSVGRGEARADSDIDVAVLADLATRAAFDAADFLPRVRRTLQQRRLAWTA